jgi:hypothetical protein
MHYEVIEGYECETSGIGSFAEGSLSCRFLTVSIVLC